MIDDFRSQRGRLTDRERAALSRVESMTLELAELDQSLDTQRDRIAQIAAERAALSDASVEVAAAEKSTAEVRARLQELDRLGMAIADGQVRVEVLGRTSGAIGTWVAEIAATARSAPVIERWPGASDGDPLEESRAHVAQLQASLESAAAGLNNRLSALGQMTESERRHVRDLEDRARALRRRVEELQQGTGSAARRLAALRERTAELESLQQLFDEHSKRRAELHDLREVALRELDSVREERFFERGFVASTLNEALGPRIDIRVQRSGLWTEYAEAIAQTIQGSGLRYKDLAPQLAACLSPPELVAAIDTQDVRRIAKCGNIPEDRARRVIDRFRDAGLTAVLTSRVEDAVDLRLLDGDQYKTTDQLSTGQRCTTVLPIVLRHDERPVIIDQPEDHLDGAFIVDTLVRAILSRPRESQLIVSTHNANIPVLGDASRVTLLGSDGHRGFERHSGSLHDPAIVDAITAIMEGGRDAFERRATFYHVGVR